MTNSTAEAQLRATPAEYLNRLRHAARVRTQNKAALVESEADVVALIGEASARGYSLLTVSRALHAEGYAVLDSRLYDLAERSLGGHGEDGGRRARTVAMGV